MELVLDEAYIRRNSDPGLWVRVARSPCSSLGNGARARLWTLCSSYDCSFSSAPLVLRNPAWLVLLGFVSGWLIEDLVGSRQKAAYGTETVL